MMPSSTARSIAPSLLARAHATCRDDFRVLEQRVVLDGETMIEGGGGGNSSMKPSSSTIGVVASALSIERIKHQMQRFRRA